MSYLDPTRLTSLRRRRNIGHRPIDTSRLTLLRRNLDAGRLTALRRRNLVPYSTSTTYRSNPDKNWGPTLYNPLEDNDHAFKDDSHYQRTIAKLRRNPGPLDQNICSDCGLRRNPDTTFCACGDTMDRDCNGDPRCSTCDGPCLMCSDGTGSRRNPEEGTGLFRSIYSRNPDYALRAVTGVNSATGSPGQALYRSLFARRNPPTSIQTASNSLVGQGLFKSIFSRRNRNPMHQWSQPHSRRHRRWGSRGSRGSSFYGV
jgi:hypothetical protein